MTIHWLLEQFSILAAEQCQNLWVEGSSPDEIDREPAFHGIWAWTANPMNFSSLQRYLELLGLSSTETEIDIFATL